MSKLTTIISKYTDPEMTFTVHTVKAFFEDLKTLDLAFHPDTPFGDYVDGAGKRTFTKDEADSLDSILAECFVVCDDVSEDIYLVGMDVFHPEPPFKDLARECMGYLDSQPILTPDAESLLERLQQAFKGEEEAA